MADRPLPAYDGDGPYVFVSYSHEDDELVYPEIRWLQDQGFSVWYDEGISGASRWRDAIAGRLGGCHLLLFFVSPNSVESQVCREELEFVLDLGRPVLSIHLETTALPDGIKLAIANRQALFRQELEPDDYERKLLSAIATYLDQPIPVIDESRRAPTRKSSRQRAWFLAVVCSVLVGSIAVLGTWFTMRPDPPTPRAVRQFTIELPDDVTFPTGVFSPLDISPDGRHIVFNAEGPSGRHLYVHSLSTGTTAPIEGAWSGIGSVFVSPDGEWIGFHDVSEKKLKKVRVNGGRPVSLADVENNWDLYGASWGRNGDIAFFDLVDASVVRVSAEGSVAEPLIDPKDGESLQPHFLADGRALVYTVSSAGRRSSIAVLSPDTGEQRILVEDGHSPRVASSGHLLFARDEAVWAVAFDPERLEVLGRPRRVLEDVLITAAHPPALLPSAHFHIADDGTLAYVPKEVGASVQTTKLVWVDRQGHETPLAAPPKYYGMPRISPDGRRIVAMVLADGQSDIWIYSVEQGTSLRLTSDPASEFSPLWSPDGERVAFGSDRNGMPDLFWKSANGTGDVEPLIGNSTVVQDPLSWSSDGKEILFSQTEPGNLSRDDIWVLSLNAERTARPLLQTESGEVLPALSPNGEWVAYTSDQSRRLEVYIRPYPDVNAGLLPVSTGGGMLPKWSPDGREIIYMQQQQPESFERHLVAVPFDDGVLGQPQTLMDLGPYVWGFDVHPDGKRFLLVKEQSREGLPNDKFVVVLNWFEELNRLVPTD